MAKETEDVRGVRWNKLEACTDLAGLLWSGPSHRVYRFFVVYLSFYHVALYIPFHHYKNIPIKNIEVLSLKYYTKTEHVKKLINNINANILATVLVNILFTTKIHTAGIF